jgi:hypothetical protein
MALHSSCQEHLANFTQHAAAVARHLLGAPNRALSSKRELRFGARGSLAVVIAGQKIGSFYDHEQGTGGDLLGLIQHVTGSDFRGALDLANDFVGNAAPPPSRPKPKRSKPNPDAWRRIWQEAVDPCGTVVEIYLRSRRLILLDETSNTVIRFHGGLWHDGGRRPGMVCLFRDIINDQPCGIHRTFFDNGGHKIDRRMLGRAGGAAIKLSADETVEQGLHVGEGVETCIAAMLAGYTPTWALGSAGGIAKFPLLSGIDAISILTERDDRGANERAVGELQKRWFEREILVVEPLVGGDLNAAWSADHA